MSSAGLAAPRNGKCSTGSPKSQIDSVCCASPTSQEVRQKAQYCPSNSPRKAARQLLSARTCSEIVNGSSKHWNAAQPAGASPTTTNRLVFMGGIYGYLEHRGGQKAEPGTASSVSDLKSSQFSQEHAAATTNASNFLDFMSDAYDTSPNSKSSASVRRQRDNELHQPSNVWPRVLSALSTMCDHQDPSANVDLQDTGIVRNNAFWSILHVVFAVIGLLCSQHSSADQQRANSEECHCSRVRLAHRFISHCWNTANELVLGADYLYDSK